MVLFGTNPIAWSNDDDRTIGQNFSLEQCLSETAKIGFDGIENGHKFPNTSTDLLAVLRPHNLAFISGWWSLNLLVQDAKSEILAMNKYLELLKACGSKVAILCETSNCVYGLSNQSITKKPSLALDEWGQFGSRLTEVATQIKSRGVTPVYHHHMGTIVQTSDEIDLLMDNTGNELNLLLDTGHAYFGGSDPVTIATKYMDRIGHLHAKNIRPDIMEKVLKTGMSFLDGVLAGVFTVPGDSEGCIDFPAILNVLAQNKYNGWIVIEAEQDPDIRNPFEYQSMGLKSLKQFVADVGL